MRGTEVVIGSIDDVGGCPACGAAAPEPFHLGEPVPVNSCLLLRDRAAAVDFPQGELALALCPACGLIWNGQFDPALTTYSQDYEETQGFSPTFQAFIRELATDWTERYSLSGGTVVEIGCGKGEFLVEMTRAGVGTAIGIDPGVQPSRVADDVPITWIQGLFPQDLPELRADAIVCRHTLEHIAPVREFLTSIRAAITEPDRTVLLFEVPDVLRVLDEVAFWDVYYEHSSYFSAGSVGRLFRAAGFEVLRIERAYSDQTLLVEARPAIGGLAGVLPIEESPAELAEAAGRFARGHQAMVEHWRDRIQAVEAGGGRTVIWGGGSKGVAFLAALGAHSDLVAGVVDINPFKQNQYMAGTGHRVLAPKELTTVEPALVIVMNGAYRTEIGNELADLGLTPIVEAL
ncbi:class I SAM-dependent methyltransferase [Ruania zhangjianzhongii]|uniref:class I SAM-dependent methyltransferase n=1 Tax=Ruania zhangjianzhongii TaxID=2603206 RepID=UPI0011CBCC39|nr:class I SAM-dependent methyltransferase [Ruania zhangjianzhongii]